MTLLSNSRVNFLFQTKDDIFSNLRQSYLQIKEYICIKTKKKCIFQRRPFFAHTKFANIRILSSKLLVNYYILLFLGPQYR